MNNIKWDISKETLVKKMMSVIGNSKAVIDKISKLDMDDKNDREEFVNLISDDLTSQTSLQSICVFLQIISKDQDLKECCWKLSNKLSEHAVKFDNHEEIYNKIVQYYLSEDRFSRHDSHFVKKLYSYYNRNGMKLTPEEKDKYYTIKKKIIRLEAEIVSDIKNSVGVINLTDKELEGVSKSFLSGLKRKYNKYQVPLSKHVYTNCMRYVSDPEVRRKLYHYYYKQYSKNADAMLDLFVTKHALAKLMSYNNYSDMKAEQNMAKSSKEIRKFMLEISDLTNDAFDKEMKVLLRLKAKECQNNKVKFNNEINCWDIDYYYERWKEEYGLNENKISRFFPHTYTLNAIFKLYEDLFHIKIEEISEKEVWDKDVKLYRIYDNVNHEKILSGYFYLDPFCRDGKTKVSRCFSLRQACDHPIKGGKQIPVAALVLSFYKEKDIAFLKHSDVVTMMHEMCHVLHNIFGYSRYSMFSGVNVETDFVETPSLVIEKLCWEKDVLKKISKHYRTEEPLPDAIINKLIKIKNMNLGYVYKNHILYSLYDQMVHSNNKFIEICINFMLGNEHDEKLSQKFMINAFNKLYSRVFTYKNLDGKYISINNMDKSYLPASKIGIVTGFDAQMYNYLWSDVHATDIYCSKFSDYKYNSVGLDFRDKILSHGGTKDAIVLITDYLERKPSIDNFLSYNRFVTNQEDSLFFDTKYFNMDDHAMTNSETADEILPEDNSDHITIIEDLSPNLKNDVTDTEEYSNMNKFTEINDSEMSNLGTFDIEESDIYNKKQIQSKPGSVFIKADKKKKKKKQQLKLTK